MPLIFLRSGDCKYIGSTPLVAFHRQRKDYLEQHAIIIMIILSHLKIFLKIHSQFIIFPISYSMLSSVFECQFSAAVIYNQKRAITIMTISPYIVCYIFFQVDCRLFSSCFGLVWFG